MAASFHSDNVAPVAPAVLAAIARASAGEAPPYGADAATAALDGAFSALFETAVRVVPAASGTAANGLALAALAAPGARIYCHEGAHVAVAEAGAPALFVPGARCVTLPGAGGRIDPAALADALGREDGANAVLTLTQATEAGTLYRAEEIAALAGLAKAKGLSVHMDGARFANAVAALGCAPAAITWRAGVDALTFGASKNGALNAEAVVLFGRDPPAGFGDLRKRTGHTYSKMRFVAAQLAAMLDDGLWLALARRANGAARRLADRLAQIPGIRLAHPVEANMLFVEADPARLARLEAAGIGHRSRGAPGRMRLVASYATTDAEIGALIEHMSQWGDHDGRGETGGDRPRSERQGGGDLRRRGDQRLPPRGAARGGDP